MKIGLAIIVISLFHLPGCTDNGGERQEPSKQLVQEQKDSGGNYKFSWERDSAETAAIRARNLARADSSMREYNRGKDEFDAYGYIEPLEFPGLPPEIANWLSQRGYRIPQVIPLIYYRISPESKFHNAVHGEYLKAGQEDWAVYATNGDTTAVFIFYGGSTKEVEIMEAECCYLLIDTATEEIIMHQYEALKEDGAPKPPPELDHDGLDIGFFEKASRIMYKYQGKWIVLAGAD